MYDDGGQPTEIVEIPIARFPASDQASLRPGMIFYMSGKEKSPLNKGDYVGKAGIRVERRKWTKKMLDSARRQAAKWAKLLGSA
jgi:hypothetical protein